MARPVVADVGCGDGHSITLLRQHWPTAKLVCIDRDKERLRRAMQNSIDSHVSFVHKEVATAADIMESDEGVNVVLANSSLHHLPDHTTLVPEIWKALPPGGVFAAQMPLLNDPHHAILEACLSELKITSPAPQGTMLQAPHTYHELLSTPDLSSFESWITSQHHYFPAEHVFALLTGETCGSDLSFIADLETTAPEQYKALRALFEKRFAEQNTRLKNGKFCCAVQRFYFVASKTGGPTMI